MASLTVWLGVGLSLSAVAQAEETTLSPGQATEVAGLDIDQLVKIKVSPFDVSSHLDNGYRASNSVSGSRLDSPIQELPFAIQAFTESFIKDQEPRDIFDVARYSPGVTYRSNDFNEGNANLAIRGFAVSSVDGGNIAVMRDGFHGPTIFDFTNVSRVEVVKGPASFLYGQLAPGGIVNIITKTPQAQFAASADARYGSYGQYRFDADVTGPLLKNLFFRLPASYDEDSHYWDPYDAHSWDVAPSLLWQPTERLSITLKYEHFSKDETPELMQKPGYNTQNGVVPTATDPNLSGVDVPGLPDNWNSMSFADFRRSKTDGVSGWIDLKTGDHWNLRVGYSHQDYSIDALFSGNLGMANNTTLLQGRRVRRQIYSNRDDTGEIQTVGKYMFSHLSLRLLLGALYTARRLDRRAGQAPNDPALGGDPTASPLPLWNLADPTTWNRSLTIPLSDLTASAYNQTDRYEDESAYAGSTFGFFDDRLLVLAGWRVTSTQSLLTNNLTAQPVFQNTATAVTPQYGLLYKIHPGLSVFSSYSESFVPGTSLRDNPDGTSSPVVPTRGQGVDIGLKTDLLGGRASGTVTFFDVRNHNILNDLAYTDSSGSVTFYHLQSGEQRSRGVEVDATFTATDNWQIYSSYSYMDARIIELTGNDAAILAQDPATLDAAGQTNYKNVKRFHNAPLQMSAPHLANLWTRYNFSHNSLHGLYLAGGFNFVYDQTLLSDTPASAQQTYTLLNATVGYAGAWHRHRIDLHLMGKNLADEHYRPSQSTRGRPREFLLGLTASL